MEDLKYFCSHLFTSLSFDQKGQVRVCCNNYETPKDENGFPILVTDEDFSMVKSLNSDVHTRIRNITSVGIKYMMKTLISSLLLLRMEIF